MLQLLSKQATLSDDNIMRLKHKTFDLMPFALLLCDAAPPCRYVYLAWRPGGGRAFVSKVQSPKSKNHDGDGGKGVKVFEV